MKLKKFLIASVIASSFLLTATPVYAESISNNDDNSQVLSSPTLESLDSLPSKNIDGIQVYGTPGQSYNTLTSDFGNQVLSEISLMSIRRELFTVTIAAYPYARVYSYNSNGVLVATSKGLASGTSWAAYLGASGKYWQVATNEFIKIGDAVN